MPKATPLYDLMLLLSTSATDEQRAKILADVERAITTVGGSIERKDTWGTRPMTYRIAHQPEAEYHLLQFSGPPSLMEPLSHDLKITDGVLRHRIIRVLAGTPPPPESPPPVLAAAPAMAVGAPSSAGAGPQAPEGETAALGSEDEREPAASEDEQDTAASGEELDTAASEEELEN
jgi:small subunit ribosomal protein S6